MADAARQLAPVIGLDDIVADPAAVDTLSQGEVAAMLVRALTAAGTLQARITRQAVMDAAHLRHQQRVLDYHDVAARLGRSVSWVERHLDALPPRREFAGAAGWLESDINEFLRVAPRYARDAHDGRRRRSGR